MHMVTSCYHMVTPFVALGNCMEYRNALASGGAISIQAVQDAQQAALHEITRLTNIIRSGDLGDYRDVPPLMNLFCPEYQLPDPTPVTRQLHFQPDQGRLDSRKRAAPATASTRDSPPPGGSSMKTTGLVKFSGSGKPPFLANLLVKHPRTTKMAMLCGNFTSQGFQCRFGDKQCNFVHLNKVADLPIAIRQQYVQFVDNHADLSWVHTPKQG